MKDSALGGELLNGCPHRGLHICLAFSLHAIELNAVTHCLAKSCLFHLAAETYMAHARSIV